MNNKINSYVGRDIALSGQLRLSDTGSDTSLPKFHLVGYTGEMIDQEWFEDAVVVELSGVEIYSQNIPVRRDHDSERGIGHTTKIYIDGSNLLADGIVSRDTQDAREFVKSAKNGFPWQSSIAGRIRDLEYIEEGKTGEVDGRTVNGPCYVVRDMLLREISVCDCGADWNTSAKVEAKLKGVDKMRHRVRFSEGCDNAPVEEDKNISEAEDCQKEEDAVTAEGEEATDETVTAECEETKPEGDVEAEDCEECDKKEQTQAKASMRKQFAAEYRRIQKIQSIAGKYPAICAKAIEQGWSADKTELTVLRASRPVHNSPWQSNVGNRLQAALNIVALRAAGRLRESRFKEQDLEAADKIKVYGLKEFLECAAGRSLPNPRSSTRDFLQAAFSTASIPGILSNTANKSLLEGFDFVDDNWKSICKINSANDFKELTRYRMNSDFKFEKLGPDGELKHGKISEEAFTNQVDTEGIMFSLTRKMIINDDLGALSEIPFEIGIGAADAICDAAWGQIMNPGNASDNKAFYHADHGNLVTGASYVMSLEGLRKASEAWAKKTRPNGRPLGVTAKTLVVPPEIMITAENLLHSTELITGENSTRGNKNVLNNRWELMESPYLSNSNYTNYSATAYYLFADPQRLAACEVAFLNGKQTPTVEQADANFDMLGVRFRGFIDFGVKAQDYRAVLKVTGAN